jgi:transcriptional regulator with GAF, ATPase, and Fis domain
VESELFGHEKGAFTGALTKRIGRFELAHGGTIFLDEIGELPADIQAKLLRVLQEREFERVGGSSSIKVDVRVIAATNRDLLKAVHERTFREDLYYRLNVFPIQVPPLRDRFGDVPLLTHFLMEKFAMRIGKRIEHVSRKTMERLLAYRWPGNIRELENVIERAVIMSDGPVLEIEPEMFSDSHSPQVLSQGADLESIERNHTLHILQQTGWVIEGPKGAARILGLHPNTLRSRMKKLGISRSSHESS